MCEGKGRFVNEMVLDKEDERDLEDKYLELYRGTWKGFSERLDPDTGILIDRTQTKIYIGFHSNRFSRVSLRAHANGKEERSFQSGTYYLDEGQFVIEMRDFIWVSSFECDDLVVSQLIPKDITK
eukprot:Ihof_evm4s142 gene=Ihof_evmTU4s142